MRFFLLPLMLLACDSPTTPPLDSPPVGPELAMRVFDVTPGTQEITASLVNRLLPERKDGRAMKGPNNTVVVMAAGPVLDGVADLVKRLDDAPPTSALSPATVEIEYWIVSGEAAPQPTVPDNLQSIGPALEAIFAADGPQELTRRQHERLVTREGRVGTLDTHEMMIEQRIEVDDSDKIHAGMKISLGGDARIETEIAVASGKYVVLAQAEVKDSNYYIVARPSLK